MAAANAPAFAPDAALDDPSRLDTGARLAWDHLQTAVDELGDPPSDEELHRVRIRAKRARYAAEALAESSDDLDRFARAAAKLQDVLGDLQDAVLVEAWLRDGTGKESPDLSFAAGALAHAARREARRARDDFPSAWKRLRRRRPKGW